MRIALLLLVLAGCPKSNEHKKTIEPVNTGTDLGSDGGRQLLPADEAGTAVVLPPAPPLPEIPLGLPPPPAGTIDAVTPEAVALGQLLFVEARVGAAGNIACAGCHDITARYNGVPRRDHPIDPRTPPQLENLAWRQRAIDALPAHVAAEMGQDVATTATRLAAIPGYAAHFARVGGTPEQAVTSALTGFVLTRYDAGSLWDHQERAAASGQNPMSNGYRLFIGKAACGTCHVPPLYTDGREHATGFAKPTVTRSLRGVAKRSELFSDGSAHSLDEAINHYTTDHPGSELKKLALTTAERADLSAYLEALTGVVPTAILQPLP